MYVVYAILMFIKHNIPTSSLVVYYIHIYFYSTIHRIEYYLFKTSGESQQSCTPNSIFTFVVHSSAMCICVCVHNDDEHT